ncbi:hypothetical protein ACFLWX_01480 [Chloroflexota bacterium]
MIYEEQHRFGFIPLDAALDDTADLDKWAKDKIAYTSCPVTAERLETEEQES